MKAPAEPGRGSHAHSQDTAGIEAQASLEEYAENIAGHARDLGQERALAVTTDDAWIARAWDAIIRFVELDVTFDADDLRAAAGTPPSSGAPGAILRRAALAGMIQEVGYRKSRSVTRRGGRQLVWRAT
jgi:hypothetical protein